MNESRIYQRQRQWWCPSNTDPPGGVAVAAVLSVCCSSGGGDGGRTVFACTHTRIYTRYIPWAPISALYLWFAVIHSVLHADTKRILRANGKSARVHVYEKFQKTREWLVKTPENDADHGPAARSTIPVSSNCSKTAYTAGLRNTTAPLPLHRVVRQL